jgi:hypothetical protein
MAVGVMVVTGVAVPAQPISKAAISDTVIVVRS